MVRITASMLTDIGSNKDDEGVPRLRDAFLSVGLLGESRMMKMQAEIEAIAAVFASVFSGSMKMQVIIEAIAVLFASILSLENNIRQFVRQCRMFYRGLGHVLVCGFA